jgi:hypothetical protein
MSPEQVSGSELDRRTDIYSLGITFFELLTARRPYTRTDPSPVAYAGVVHDVLHRPLPDIRELREDLPPGIVPILATSTAKEPDDRFDSCESFRTALDALSEVPTGAATASMPFAEKMVSVVRSVIQPSGSWRTWIPSHRLQLALGSLGLILLTFGALLIAGATSERGTPKFAPLKGVDAAAISTWFAESYAEATRRRDVEAISRLFAVDSVDYLTKPIVSRSEIERERAASLATSEIAESYQTSVARSSLLGDTAIRTVWHGGFHPLAGGIDTVPGVDSTLVIIAGRDGHFVITSFRRLEPVIAQASEVKVEKPAVSRADPKRSIPRRSSSREVKRQSEKEGVVEWIGSIRLNSNDEDDRGRKEERRKERRKRSRDKDDKD